MATTLQAIRDKLKATEQRGSDNSNNRQNADNSIYAFWNMLDGKESGIRFLPDADINNTFFWVERAMIRLPFAGILGDEAKNQIIVQVPCVEMYNDGSVCPVLSEVRGWFKEPSLEETARQYWKKRSFIFQGLITEDGLNEQDKPENPIRRFIIGPQIFALIKAALLDPELDDLPTDYASGIDFRLKKGNKGNYADYSTSSWSRRSRPLSESEATAIDTYKLNNLSEFLPKKPSAVELNIIKEMFEASVNGEAYDPEKWGQYYKPAGFTQGPSTFQKSIVSNVEKDEIPFTVPVMEEIVEAVVAASVATNVASTPVETAVAGTDNRASDILAMIRSRSAAA